jgi:hypothetical protein
LFKHSVIKGCNEKQDSVLPVSTLSKNNNALAVEIGEPELDEDNLPEIEAA